MAFTFFFRDKYTLELLVQHIIPDLKRRRYINIWDAGCAMGPEPYSLAIMLRENMTHFLFRNVKIYATDIDENGQFGKIIAHGIYPEVRIKRIPPTLLSKYFSPALPPEDAVYPMTQTANYFQVSEELKRAIRFQQHDLLSLKPVREEFALIVCKNVLLHFKPEERARVVRMFHSALAQGGYFVTEQTQKLPDETQRLFQPITSAGQLFQKV
ncbi:MAG: methyltransferase domain-containing protein [Anaerolineae bacterium]|nr:methyltransferase domain-containing protein [Anaerolineae bacterium]